MIEKVKVEENYKMISKVVLGGIREAILQKILEFYEILS